MYGHNVSHSKRRTTRTFKPNLHVARVVVNGTSKKLKLCTKCLRMYKKVAVADTGVNAPEVAPTPAVV